MSRALALATLLSLAAWADAPESGSQFSEAFHKRRAWEKEQLKPSWKDDVAVSASAIGGAQVFANAGPATVAPTITLGLELGGHLNPSLALVGLGLVEASFLKPGSELVAFGLGGGVRLGSRYSVTLGGGLAWLLLTRVTTSTSGFAPVIDVRGVIPLVDHLGVHLRAGVLFTAGGAYLDVGVGFGFSA